MRLQLALNVNDIDKAVDFYTKMFGTPPRKRKPGYANFAIVDPPLKLVLFEVPNAPEQLNHIGVEVLEANEVAQVTTRFFSAGLQLAFEEGTTCCYAQADKVWVKGPDGLAWEWYKVLADSETFGEAPKHLTEAAEAAVR